MADYTPEDSVAREVAETERGSATAISGCGANSIEGGTNGNSHDNRGDRCSWSRRGSRTDRVDHGRPPAKPKVFMSYNLAVWEGPAPLSNAHGFSDYERLQAARVPSEPTPGVGALMQKLEAADHGAPDAGLWAVPLADCASGPFLYFGANDGHEAEAIRLVERTALELGLVAFDPQVGTLLPSATLSARATEFVLPPAADLTLHLEAVIDEAINAGTAMVGIVEDLDTTYYVQWLTREGSLLVEAQGDVGLAPEHCLDADAKAVLAGLGFVENKPNWSVSWVDGLGNIDRAAQLLVQVLTEVRSIPAGARLELQTFPV